MGLQQDLGYVHARANLARRAIQQAIATRPGAWLGARSMHRLDRPVFRATGGRHTVASILGGLPVIMLTTIGRRSGQARSVPLLGIPVGDDLAVIGSNFGQANTPGWVYNLEADPSATAAYRHATIPVIARPAGPDEADEASAVGATVYPGYARYRERVTDRDIRAFVLEPGG